MIGLITQERQHFLERIHQDIVRMAESKKFGKCPNYCDKDSKKSVLLGVGIQAKLPGNAGTTSIDGQKAGSLFEKAVKEYLEATFTHLQTLRPGEWRFWQKSGDNGKRSSVKDVTAFEQYEHLADLSVLVNAHKELEGMLGNDYVIKPDVVIGRLPELDEKINSDGIIVDSSTATLSPIRATNNKAPILHATVSCKWTMRSDRSQNSRTEALNLIRNRKGKLPHIVVVTMEPLPSRIASIALGTGDIDCVYHAALNELLLTAEELTAKGELDIDDLDTLQNMKSAKRLKDISDLPLDLSV